MSKQLPQYIFFYHLFLNRLIVVVFLFVVTCTKLPCAVKLLFLSGSLHIELACTHHTHATMYIHNYAYTHMYTCKHTHTHTHTHTQTHTLAHGYTYASTYTVYTSKHTWTHTHTQIDNANTSTQTRHTYIHTMVVESNQHCA